MLFRVGWIIIILNMVSWCQGGQLVLVASKLNQISEVEKSELKSLFLGKSRGIEGVDVVPVLLNDSNYQELFVTNYLERTAIQFARTWQKLIFTGKGQRPPVFENVEDLVEFLKRNNQALSYLPKNKITPELKVIIVK